MSLWDAFVNANRNSRSRDDSEIKHIEKQFLDIWAKSHSASTIDELRFYEYLAWEKWELIMDHYDYRYTSIDQRDELEKDLLNSIDYESTGHPAPSGRLRFSRARRIRDLLRSSIFENQRNKFKRRESMERRNKSMERMKFGNRNLRGRV